MPPAAGRRPPAAFRPLLPLDRDNDRVGGVIVQGAGTRVGPISVLRGADQVANKIGSSQRGAHPRSERKSEVYRKLNRSLHRSYIG